jgi:hypothetical protein
MLKTPTIAGPLPNPNADLPLDVVMAGYFGPTPNAPSPVTLQQRLSTPPAKAPSPEFLRFLKDTATGEITDLPHQEPAME